MIDVLGSDYFDRLRFSAMALFDWAALTVSLIVIVVGLSVTLTRQDPPARSSLTLDKTSSEAICSRFAQRRWDYDC